VIFQESSVTVFFFPKFKRATNISDGIDAVAEFLMGGGESKPSK
jgi:hypothetical protein